MDTFMRIFGALKALYLAPARERPLPDSLPVAVLAGYLRRAADGAELGYPAELPQRLRQAAQLLDLIGLKPDRRLADEPGEFAGRTERRVRPRRAADLVVGGAR